MIAHIFRPAASYEGVGYNTDKIESDKGELMKVSGFGPLQGMISLRPEDYVNYLQMISNQNKRIKLPQFHAIISAKGRSADKNTLTAVASEWMKEMGYGKQPYMIVFHKDTSNNHVHIVSTRIDKEGKKINSAFEKIRAVQCINKVLGLNEDQKAKEDLTKALAYNFSTKPQFMLILETQGYALKEADGKMQLIKFGSRLAEIPVSEIKQRISEHTKKGERAKQLTAIFERYRHIYDPALRFETTPLPGGFEKNTTAYTSDLALYLKEKHGLVLLFHSKDNKPAYGYTVIDHAKGNVFKGGEIMDLDVLTQTSVPVQTEQAKELASDLPDRTADLQPRINVSISDDIDDEAIHGRNRQRKKQARTNTR